jgi:membrane-associated protein
MLYFAPRCYHRDLNFMDFSNLQEFFRFLLDSEDIIRYGGLALVTLIVFAENGLFFAFFLPGDYLLFLAGLFTSSRQLDWPITVVMGCIILAAVLGSLVGYYFGMALGHNLENRKESFFFKRKNLEQSRAFFSKYGGRALILARFMPVVRTFSPIIAGTIRMPFRSFLLYNILGGVLWGVSLPLAGFYLGQTFPQIINYVEWIIVFFLAITSLALVRTIIKVRRSRGEPAE